MKSKLNKEILKKISSIALLDEDKQTADISIEDLSNIVDTAYEFAHNLRIDFYRKKFGEYKNNEGKYIILRYDRSNYVYMHVISCFPIYIEGEEHVVFQGLGFEYKLNTEYADGNVSFSTFMERDVKLHDAVYSHRIREISKEEFENKFKEMHNNLLETYNNWKKNLK